MRDAILVTEASQLETALFRLHAAARLAIDTEFMRERTYRPQLCLLQIASDTDCFLVDTLAGLDLAPLLALLDERSRPKILHAARQDLEVLYLAGGRIPGPVFDTQVAAALLGFAPQIGYADLVARQLGASIDKGQTRTDWSRRPLTPEQLAYAADDVRHLLELNTELASALAQKGRIEWLDEEMAAVEAPALYRTEPDDAWRRLKGLARLGAREQAIARALAGWREQRASDADKPRGWILADEAIYEIATLSPRTREDLSRARAVPPSVIQKRGDELLALVATAADGEQPPALTAQPRPTPEQNAASARLMQIVRDTAEQLGISPEVLATRRDVEALVFGRPERSAVMHGWRYEVVGKLLAV